MTRTWIPSGPLRCDQEPKEFVPDIHQYKLIRDESKMVTIWPVVIIKASPNDAA